MSVPSIGRIVRYVLASGKNAGVARPAIITNVLKEDSISLTCFPDAGNDGTGVTLSAINVHYSEIQMPGTWHWPSQP